MKKELKAEELQKAYNSLKTKQSTWTTISNLNKLYKVDRILLKFAFDHYPGREILESSNEYKNIEKFYRNILDRLLEIEREYLSDDQLGENLSPYQINKNSTSKFIRDENDYYKATFKESSQKINEDDNGINGLQIFSFIKKLFDTNYTAIISNGQNYFDQAAAQDRAEQVEQSLKRYHVASKEMEEADFVASNVFFTEDQMLDFLSHWLKEKENQHFYVLYCRTEEKLKADSEYLKQEAVKRKEIGVNGETNPPTTHPIGQKTKGECLQNLVENSMEELQREMGTPSYQDDNSGVLNILKKYRKNKVQEDEYNVKPSTPKPAPTSRQQVEAKMKQIFQSGCKRRYVVSKSTTFDQIQSEGKTMNLEKFINFCRHNKITDVVSRELLSELFKMYAINRLLIDEEKFKIVMDRVMDTEKKVIDLLLHSQQYSGKVRVKNVSELSDYKFRLRPVNGKDPASLKNQLQLIKIAKSQSRQDKLNQFYVRRKELKDGVLPGKKKKIALSSYRLPEKTSLLEMENMRDDNFDPEKFFNDDYDDLLSAYESKMEKKVQEKSYHLDSVLSKRIERGERVVKKMTAKNLKLYD